MWQWAKNEQVVTILESISEAFFALDCNWRFTYLNKEAEKFCLKTREELLGKNIWEEYQQAVNSIFYYKLTEAMNEQKPVHFEAPSAINDKFFECHAYPAKRGILVFYRDITERKQEEEKLRLSQERFLKAFNASPDLMTIKTLEEGRYIEVNNGFERVSGYSRSEAIGNTFKDLNFYYFDPENPEQRINITNMLLERGSIHNMEVKFRKKTGEECIGLASAEIITIGEEKCMLLVVTDITARKNFEKEMTRLSRLNLVGQMAAGIGHEIRNPITTVRGFLQLLRRKEECAKYEEYYDLMIEELDRANAIISEFLSVAKNKEAKMQLQNLNSIVQALYPLLIADALNGEKYIELELNKLPEIYLNEKEIRQLILNLARNGLEAMITGGTLIIRTFAEGNQVVLALKDEGKGIDQADLERIGTPFFTTKENGTGLGLTICYSIAARHNAIINIETSPHGTTFFVRFTP